METPGARIRKRRKELGMTIPELSEKTGISKGNLSIIETDKSLPSATALISLSECLNCSIDWILLNKSEDVSKVEYQEAKLNITEKLLLKLFGKLNDYDQNYIVDEIDRLLNGYSILSPKSKESIVKESKNFFK